jgi:uncharacterized protein (TIGR02996 family)
MAVHFVYRCYYNAPSERHIRRFEFDTVLDWFRSIWKPIPDEKKARQHAEELLGGVAGSMFAHLFVAIAEQELPRPENTDEILEGFQDVYIEEEDHGPHHLEMLTEDGNQTAVHLLDDHFRGLHPGLTDFLLLDGWELPGDVRPSHPVRDRGTLHALSLFTECKYNLEDLDGPSQVAGVRVPELCRHVLTQPNEKALEYGLRSLRRSLRKLLAAPGGEDAGFRAAIRDHPDEEVHWAVYSDWLQDRGQPPAGLYLLEAALRAAKVGGARKNRDPARDLVKVTPHMAQVCKHEGSWTPSFPGAGFRESYTQWIFFDDCWAAAHPTLADGILRFASRWDVLSSEAEEEDEW